MALSCTFYGGSGYQQYNKVTNSNFSGGVTTGWTPTSCGISVISQEMVMLGTASCTAIQTITTVIIGHSYYFRAKVKTSIANKIRIGFNSVYSTYHTGGSTYQILSNIKPSASATSLNISLYDTRTSAWDNVYWDDIMVIDLTAIFGAGNEPDKTWCDTHIVYDDSNMGGIFSKIWGRNIIPTTQEVQNYTIGTYVPNWKNESYILAYLNNTLESGSISTTMGTIQNLILYRLEQENGFLELLDTLDPLYNDFDDFRAINNKTYWYYLFVKSATSISSPIVSDSIQSDYYGWYLIDEENNRAYHFDINFSGGDKTYIEDYMEYETNTKNNIFTRGGNFYIEGVLNTIISKNNLKINTEDTNGDLLSLSEFINSDRTKILKNRRGEIFKVFTHGYQEKVLNPALSQNIYSVSVSFKEIGGI